MKKKLRAFFLRKLGMILIWALNKAFVNIKAQVLPTINKLYLENAQDNLRIKTEIINVKKGKRRYDLLFFETKNGQLRFNLGKYWEEDMPLNEAIDI